MSKKNEIRLISVQDVSVMASIEYHSEEPHDSYYPLNILFFIQKGNLHLGRVTKGICKRQFETR